MTCLHKILLICLSLSGCKTLQIKERTPIELPFIKNSADECYYLDQFMPTPDGMVAGRHGSLNLRYYSYKAANYKEWEAQEIILSFYSQDTKCWSLFEEYYVRK